MCLRGNKITRGEWRGESGCPKPVCWQAHLGNAKGRRPPIQYVPPSGLFPQLNTGTARGTTETEERSPFSHWKENVLQSRSASFFFFLHFLLHFLLSFLSATFFMSLTSSSLNYHHDCLFNTYGKQCFQETTLTDSFILWRNKDYCIRLYYCSELLNFQRRTVAFLLDFLLMRFGFLIPVIGVAWPVLDFWDR